MNTVKSPLTSLTIVPLVVSLVIAILGQFGLGVTDEETQVIIGAVAAVIAIIGRWRATSEISIKAPIKPGAPIIVLLCLLIAGCTADVRLPAHLAAEVQRAEIEARTALLGTDPNAVAEELRDSTGVLLAVYDPNHAYLSAPARFTLAEVIAIAEADYRDCAADPDTCRSGLVEAHWWLRWLMYTNAEMDME